MINKYNLNQSLEDIENEKWDKPDSGSSLVEKVSNIRKKLLKDLTTEDLRLMIGQQFSLDFTIPLALNILERNPYEEGDYYSGDLLVQVLSIKYEFWKTRKELFQRIEQIINKIKVELNNIEDKETASLIRDALAKFLKATVKK